MIRFLVVSLSAVLMMTLGLWDGSLFLDQKTTQAASGDGSVDLAVAICADELTGPPLTDLDCVGTKFDGSAHTGTAMIVGQIGGTHPSAVEVQIHNPDPVASAMVDMTVSAASIAPGCVAHFSHQSVDIHVRGDFDNDAGTADEIRHLSLEDRRAANAVPVAARTTTRVTLSLLVTCDSTPLPSGSAAFRTDLTLISSIAVQGPLVEDDFSNNIAEGSSITLDNDGDGEPNAADNCVDDPNPGQEDADNDNIGDTCDTDDDDDGTADTLENFLGTDPLDNCGINAWPPDTTDNGTVNAGDFGILVDSWQKSSGEDGYIQRADLSGNGTVNAGDLGPIAETWQLSCT